MRKATMVVALLAAMAAGCITSAPEQATIATSLSPEKEEGWSLEVRDVDCAGALMRFARITRTPTIFPGNLPKKVASGLFEGATAHDILLQLCHSCTYVCTQAYVHADPAGRGIVIVAANDGKTDGK